MAAGLRILLAEDDPVSRSFLEEVLANAGHVVAVADGESALAAAHIEPFDVVVLDQNLPGLDGRSVLGALRGGTDSMSMAARAIALSAGLDAADALSLRQAGFDAALAKPIDAARLLDCVRGVVVGDAQSPQARGSEVLDDAIALNALAGNPATVARLRGLLASELPAQIDAVTTHFDARQADALCEHLHRLQAGCGFCGATQLQGAARRLARTVGLGAFSRSDLEAFMLAARRLQSALEEASATDRDF